MIKKLIGLAGQSGVGKGLVADYISQKYQYKKVSVAETIREEASEIFKDAFDSVPLPKDFYDVVFPGFIEMIWGKPTNNALRIFLQWLGTDYLGHHYILREFEQKLNDEELIVVTDLRTPNNSSKEIDLVHKFDGEVWLMERNDIVPVGIQNHCTEQSINHKLVDRIITNNGTTEDLLRKIDFIFQEC